VGPSSPARVPTSRNVVAAVLNAIIGSPPHAQPRPLCQDQESVTDGASQSRRGEVLGVEGPRALVTVGSAADPDAHIRLGGVREELQRCAARDAGVRFQLERPRRAATTLPGPRRPRTTRRSLR
jgi:hypothetical protein